MKLGVVESTEKSGKRVLMRVRVDEAIYDDVVLVHALHVRSKVEKGSRVFLGYLDGDDTALLAWPMEYASQTEDVVIRRDDGIQIRLRDGTIEIVGPDIRVGSSPDLLAPITNGVVIASGIDPFTGATYGALGSASAKVMAEK